MIYEKRAQVLLQTWSNLFRMWGDVYQTESFLRLVYLELSGLGFLAGTGCNFADSSLSRLCLFRQHNPL